MNEIEEVITTLFLKNIDEVVPNSIHIDFSTHEYDDIHTTLSAAYSYILTVGMSLMVSTHGYFTHAISADGKINISKLTEDDLDMINVYFAGIGKKVIFRKRDVEDIDNGFVYDDGLDDYYDESFPYFNIIHEFWCYTIYFYDLAPPRFHGTQSNGG